MNSGVGGYGTILVYAAKQQKCSFLNSSDRIPRGVNSDLFRPPTIDYEANRRGAKALDVLVRSPRATPEIHGISGSTEVLAELHVWRLRINNSIWRNRVFLVGEFPVFETLGLNREPAAIVGADLFGGRDFIVDFTRRRLLVKSR